MKTKTTSNVQNKRKRRYFKSDIKGEPASALPSFLVRFFEEDGNLNIEGPFTNEDDALSSLSTHLKDGTCAWVVSYNGD